MNNISLNVYNEKGTDVPIICLHGFLETKEMWSNLHLFFSNHPIYCIDLPGHGQSSLNENTKCSLQTIGKMIMEALGQMKITECYVLGHSMGGYVALALLELFPEMVRKVILLNSNYLADSESKRSDRVRGIHILRKHPKLYFNQAFEPLFLEPEKHSEVIQQLMDRAQTTGTDGILYAIEAMMNRKDQSELVKMNADKVFMIQGEMDTMFMSPPENQSTLPLKQWFKVFNSKHMSIFERETETMLAIGEVIAID